MLSERARCPRPCADRGGLLIPAARPVRKDLAVLKELEGTKEVLCAY